MAGWIDDNPSLRGISICGRRVLGSRRELPSILRGVKHRRLGFVVAVGNNEQRGEIFDELLQNGLTPVNAIHPNAMIADSVRLGRGIMVCAGVVVSPDSSIEDNVIINTAASVDHDNRIERDAHLSPGVHTGGHVRVGRGAHIGIGAVVLPDRSVGAYTVVGAGAVVDKDLAERVVAVGVPARAVRTRPAAS